MPDSSEDSSAQAQNEPRAAPRYRQARPFASAAQRALPCVERYFSSDVFYTLKLASSFFIPLTLAILLNFVFASTIRTLGRFSVPTPRQIEGKFKDLKQSMRDMTKAG